MTKRKPHLTVLNRQCVCCQAEALSVSREIAARGDHVPMLSVNMTVYGMTPRGKVLKAVPKINICATCLCKAVMPARLMESKEALRLFAALKQRIGRGYNRVFGGEAA